MIHKNFKKAFNECSMICFPIKRKQNKQAKWWWYMKTVKTSVSWLFWKDWNFSELMFRNLFPHWVKKMKQVNWWLNTKISKRFSNNFKSVFSLKINKQAIFFNFRPLKMKIYFMFFDLSDFSTHVWKWWFINSVFFKSFWPTRPPKTRLREW